MKNKPVYKPLSQKDLSNPFHRIPHEELLRKAGAIDLTDNYEVLRSDETRLIIKPVNRKRKIGRRD